MTTAPSSGVPLACAVNTPIGSDANDYDTPNQLGWGYTAANRYSDHGTFYLAINSLCVWEVQIID